MYPKHMMRQTVTVAALNGSDDYGKSTFDAGIDSNARVELVSRLKVNAAGDTVAIALVVWLPGEFLVETGSKVTYGGEDYAVESRTAIPDGIGTVRMTRLECKEWL
jgi:hypothetical protein